MIASQKKVLSVITHVCPESKFRTHPNLYQLNWWFIYSFKVILHLILHCAYMNLKHIILLKENKKLFKAIKTQTKNKNFSQQNIEILSSCLDSRGTWRKLYRLLKSFFLFHLVFFRIGIHSMQGWTASARHEVARKRN